MRKRVLFIKEICSFMPTFACISMLLTSCINSIGDTATNYGNIPIRLSTTIQSRVENNKFEKIDTIGVFLLENGHTLSAERFIDNEPFYFKGSNVTSRETLYYPQEVEKCDILSYYPFKEEGALKGSSQLTLRVRENQKEKKDFDQSDFMIAKSLGIVPSQEAVALRHEHKLALLDIVLEPANSLTAGELLGLKPTITILDLKTTGNYDLESGEISNPSNIADIIPHGEWHVQDSKLIGLSAILLPQKVAGEASFIKLKIGEEQFIYSIGTDLTLEASKRHTLTIPYSNTAANLNVTISDWDKGVDLKTSLQRGDGGIVLAALDFDKSKVYNITDENGTLLGQICKEYIATETLDASAIVSYKAINGKIDIKEGTILKIFGQDNHTNGGTIEWTDETNLKYNANQEILKPIVYFNQEGKFSFDKPAVKRFIKILPDLLIDKRGNEIKEYPIIKIGTQYWTAEDLSATTDIDGTSLTQKEILTKDEKTSCYLSKKGAIFYNFAVVNSAKLSPAGWMIPSKSDWEVLKSYIKSDAQKLKFPIWSYKGTYPNNITGFGALGKGFVAHDGDEGIYMNEGTAIDYWYTDSEHKTTEGRLRIIKTNNEIQLLGMLSGIYEEFNLLKACSIRLVRK